MLHKTWKPFVQNRVRSIRQLVPRDNWKHCGGWENPADLPSRGITVKELIGSALWLQGLGWLGESEPGVLSDTVPGGCLGELKVSSEHQTCSMVIIEQGGVSDMGV